MLATARSPLFSSFGEVLDGITTVRAFSSELDFLRIFDENVDQLLAKMYYNWTTNRWMLLRFDALGALATFTSMSEFIPLSQDVEDSLGEFEGGWW